jgi:hypothetical protein
LVLEPPKISIHFKKAQCSYFNTFFVNHGIGSQPSIVGVRWLAVENAVFVASKPILSLAIVLRIIKKLRVLPLMFFCECCVLFDGSAVYLWQRILKPTLCQNMI